MLVRTLVFCCVVSNVKKSNVVRFWRSQAQSKPHTKFESEAYILSKDEGGRHISFFKGYRPQFYFRTTDVTGTIELPEGVEMVEPGDNIKMVVTLIHPIRDGRRSAFRNP